MKRILLMRHALAGFAPTDFDRPLLPEGLMQVHDIAHQLRDLLPQVDNIICSSSLRTRQTLESLSVGVSAVFEPQLYHASAERLLAELQLLDESVQFPLMIGHNPGMIHFVRQVTGADHDFPPAGAALIETVKPWKSLRFLDCQLTTFYYPPI